MRELRWTAALALATWLAGCGAAVPAGREPGLASQELLLEGTRLARTGELVRAEQYLVAAERAGAPRGQVLPLLLRVCVRSGQQRRALAHLERVLRDEPERAELWVLAGALAWAVGDLAQAERHLATADELTSAPADVAYWQARVALGVGDPERAADRLRAYLADAPAGRFAAWARYWLVHEGGGAT